MPRKEFTAEDLQKYKEAQKKIAQEQAREEAEDAKRAIELNKEIRQYWEKYIQAILHPYKTDSILKKFITNRAVTGAFGEALIHSLIQKMLPHLRISTGAIVSLQDHVYIKEQKIKRSKIPQADLIIWDPSVLPAAFDIGDFALVSNLAARGVIEVKRSSTKRQIERTREKLKKWRRYISMVSIHPENKLFMDCSPNIIGVVIRHRTSLLEEAPQPNMWDKPRPSPIMVRLFDNDYSEDIDGFLALMYFLAHIAKQPERTYFKRLEKLQSELKKHRERSDVHHYHNT